MNTTAHSIVKVILFDLGNVLIELRESPIPAQYLPQQKPYTVSEWLKLETAILFDKGLIDAQTFARRLKNELHITISTDKIVEHFTQWPIRLFPGVETLLSELSSHYELATLTNTNELHWPQIVNEFKIPEYFKYVFASHLLHMAKPEAEIFEHVINTLKVEPQNILFLDDNKHNIAASEKLGIQSLQVKGLTQLQDGLVKMGIINT